MKIFLAALTLVSLVAASMTSPAYANARVIDDARSARSQLENTERSQLSVQNDNDTPVSSDDSPPASVERRNGENGRVRACENREAAISRIMDRFVRLSERQAEVIGTLAERVDRFYEENELSVEDYEDYTAAVDSAREQLDEAILEMKGYETFSCRDANPKEQIAEFRSHLPLVIEEVRSYRDAVRELVVAVRTATEGDSDEDAADATTESATEDEEGSDAQ